MGSRIHPMPGEPFCPACHASDDVPCSAKHKAWADEIRKNYCGFCHKPREGVRTMIELTGVAMCDECVRQAYEMCFPTCAAEGCENEARYDSGYCGVCDITHNDGKGTLK
jgi:hypothetical protein